MRARSLLVALALAVFGMLGLLALRGADSGLQPTKQLYTCGMHPQIIKDEPGNCPICGMKLTPIRQGGAGATSGERHIKYYKSTMLPGEVSPKPAKDSMGMDMVPVYDDAPDGADRIHIDAVTVQRMNLKTGLVTRGPVKRDIRTVGAVAYNEETLRDITTKYDAWIEKLFVNAPWTPVKAGQPLFELYSPDLYNAELNYLVARKGDPDGDGPLTRAALGRLQLFDIPPEFVAELAKNGVARRTFTYRAPSDGVVIEKAAVVGQMMKPGERIYRVADLSTMWVEAAIYEQDLPFVHAGDVVTIRPTYGAAQSFTGTIALVAPEVQAQTRAATARIVVPNPTGVLRAGMYVDIRLESQIADSALLVPETAILRSGEKNTVFVAQDGGTFDPREVTLGARSGDGDYQILGGLKEGERVVTSGQFMLDSESQLQEAIQNMTKTTEGASASSGTHDPAAGSGATAGTPVAATARSGARALPTDALTNLALASADAAAALAKDDLAGYDSQRERVNAALNAYRLVSIREASNSGRGFARESEDRSSPLSRAEPLKAASDLAAARKNFEPFSTAVADLARAAHLQHTAGLHVFECPMPPSGGAKVRWLQRTSGTQNPFYGSAMPTCGEELH